MNKPRKIYFNGILLVAGEDYKIKNNYIKFLIPINKDDVVIVEKPNCLPRIINGKDSPYSPINIKQCSKEKK